MANKAIQEKLIPNKLRHYHHKLSYQDILKMCKLHFQDNLIPAQIAPKFGLTKQQCQRQIYGFKQKDPVAYLRCVFGSYHRSNNSLVEDSNENYFENDCYSSLATSEYMQGYKHYHSFKNNFRGYSNTPFMAHITLNNKKYYFIQMYKLRNHSSRFICAYLHVFYDSDVATRINSFFKRYRVRRKGAGKLKYNYVQSFAQYNDLRMTSWHFNCKMALLKKYGKEYNIHFRNTPKSYRTLEGVVNSALKKKGYKSINHISLPIFLILKQAGVKDTHYNELHLRNYFDRNDIKYIHDTQKICGNAISLKYDLYPLRNYTIRDIIKKLSLPYTEIFVQNLESRMYSCHIPYKKIHNKTHNQYNKDVIRKYAKYHDVYEIENKFNFPTRSAATAWLNVHNVPYKHIRANRYKGKNNNGSLNINDTGLLHSIKRLIHGRDYYKKIAQSKSNDDKLIKHYKLSAQYWKKTYHNILNNQSSYINYKQLYYKSLNKIQKLRNKVGTLNQISRLIKSDK